MGINCTLHSIPAEVAQAMARGGQVDYPPGVTLELDQSWHALHFLVTGTGKTEGEDPSHFILNGVQLEDVSEHATVHTHEEVIRFNSILEALSDAQLLTGYDQARMESEDIYGGRFDDELATLIDHFERLRTFIADTAVRGHGVLTTIV